MVTYVSALFYGAGGIVVAVVALVALLVTFQDKLIYPSALRGVTGYYPITPAWHDLNYEEVWFWSSDGTVLLHSWFIKMSPGCRGPTILFFQENAGTTDVRDTSFNNVLWRLQKVRIMMHSLKCNIFMLSYRGYGQSGGYPSEHGIIKDAQAALDHLCQRTDIDTSRIVVFGRSLGGAVGAVLAKNNPEKVSALILENTFTSILDMVGAFLPFLKLFIGGSGSKSLKHLNFLVRSPWNTIDAIGEVKQPVLFISGLKDEIVPPSHMKMLYAKAAARNSQCTFVEFPNGKHSNTWVSYGLVYFRTVMKFLEEHAPEERKQEVN